jgi:predicted DNA-binding antitoxin AbrB/MazE fold protein
MVQQVEAVYENGLLRPLEPLNLADSQRVRITVTTPELGRSKRDMKLLEQVRAEVAGMTEIPSLEEVQRMLSAIPGSLTEDFVAEREDR